MTRPLKIVSTGKYLPARQVSASELETRMGLEPGFIVEKSGVEIRNWVTDDTNATMGAKALQQALERANMAYEELDLIMSASGSYDHPLPDNASLIQRAMGKGSSGTPAWSLDSTCLSFVTALDVASCLIAAGRYRTIAIVSSEIASKSLNFEEWESASLLGDGAAAAIVQAPAEGEASCLLNAVMETYGDGAFLTYVKAGGNAYHPRDEKAPDYSEYTFHMDGPAVLQMAFRKLPAFLKKLFGPLGFGLKELNLFIPHQASKGALVRFQKIFGLTDRQFMNHLATHGNCIAASIPMAFHDAIVEGRLERGDRLCMLGTAAGLSVGGVVLIY